MVPDFRSLALPLRFLFPVTALTIVALLWPDTARADLSLSPDPASRASAVSAISISAPAAVSATEGDSVTVTATAGSGDPRSIITLTVTGAPPGLVVTTNTPTAIHPMTTVSGLLGDQTAGVWLLRWHATDQLGAVADLTTRLEVAGVAGDQILDARAFTVGGDQTFRVSSGKPAWCVQIEPIDGAFDLSEVDMTSIALTNPAFYGSVPIPALQDKSSIDGDRDRNGVPEITACFAREPLIFHLFGGVLGEKEVRVAVGGNLLSGGRFLAYLNVRVFGSGKIHTSVAPNPMNPGATLSILVPRAGFLRVRLFDVSGRHVATLADERHVTEGHRAIAIDPRDGRGRGLTSGIYLYRVETEAGSVSGRLAIVR